MPTMPNVPMTADVPSTFGTDERYVARGCHRVLEG